MSIILFLTGLWISVRNGTYMVKMKLKGPIPQNLPLSYGLHARQKCRNEKVLWIKYVENFMKLNSEIEREQYVDGAVVYKWQN